MQKEAVPAIDYKIDSLHNNTHTQCIYNVFNWRVLHFVYSTPLKYALFKIDTDILKKYAILKSFLK